MSKRGILETVVLFLTESGLFSHMNSYLWHKKEERKKKEFNAAGKAFNCDLYIFKSLCKDLIFFKYLVIIFI